MTRQVFTLPDLGEGLEDAQLVKWLVAVGDTVTVDCPVAEVETAKAMVEVPCPYAGVVSGLHGDAGDVIAVGAPLVSVDDTADAQDPAGRRDGTTGQEGTAGQDGVGRQDAHEAEEPTGSGNVLIGYGTSVVAERGSGRRAARRAAAVAGPSSPPGPVPPGPVAVVSPLVRTLARTSGVDLSSLQGTGPGGLITRSDVEGAAAAAPRDAGDTGTDARTGLSIGRRIPIRGVRKSIAQTMSRSRQEIPEATTWVDVDATALVELRGALSRRGRPAPGLLALVARFVVAGLGRFPELNSRVDVDGEQILHLEGVNLGIATQTDRGLVVPVVRGAHLLPTRGLDAEIRRLTTVARAGRATAADLTGGSFTLNNYGTLGVDGSAAIINHPEVAILGLGRIIPRPWVVDGAVVVRSIAQLSLVFDHRVCDGTAGGGFLRYVADAIESPVAALVDVAEL